MTHLGKHLLLAAGLALAALPAAAQEFPQKTIRFIVPFAAGGGTDILARQIAQEMTNDWHQPVLVENRAGGATVAGTELVAHAPPDGYTLLLTANPFSVNPSLLKSLPYDTVKDLVPVTRVALSPLVLVVTPSVPATNLAELLALARAKPGSLNYASSGVAGPEHLAGAMLASMTGTSMVHVPFRGSGPAIVALLGGQVQMSFTSMLSALPQIKAGLFRPIAISGTKRSPALPDVPTVSETPGLADYEEITWYGVLAPGGTPPALVEKLQTEIARTLTRPMIQNRLNESGAMAVGDTPAEFAAFLARDIARNKDIVTKAGIHAE